MEILTLIAVLAGFYVVWNIGANDTANCVGTALGGRILSHRLALSIVIIFVILGASLEGWKNMRTVGEGIVIGAGGTNPLSSAPSAVIAALLATGVWLSVATGLGIPVSTSQAMVGSVIGTGALLSYIKPDGLTSWVQPSVLGAIAISWILNPVFAGIMAYVISRAIAPFLRKIKNLIVLNRVLIILVIAATAATAYALGANDVGTSTGAIYAFFSGSEGNEGLMMAVGVFGGIGLSIGALTYSHKVIRTLGRGITKLDALSAFAAQLSGALTVWSFVQFGIPVSTTQAMVGAVVGVGLAKGMKTVSGRKVGLIGAAWILGPLITCMLSFGLGWLLLGLDLMP